MREDARLASRVGTPVLGFLTGAVTNPIGSMTPTAGGS